MSKRFKKLIMLSAMIVSMFSTTVTAYALPTEVVDYLEEHAPGGNAGKSDWASSISKYFSIATDSTHTETVTIGAETGSPTVFYYSLADEDNIANVYKSIANTSTATNRVEEITGDLNIAADTKTATSLLSGFIPVISTLLGILTVGITLAMTVFSGVDICYIAFPAVRGKMEDSRNTGGVMSQKTSDGGTKLRFVSDEAQWAVQEAITNPGKNAMVMYFGKRVISYIVLSIVLFIIMTGNISLITNLALKAVDGVLRVLQGI